jgi:hypothetical protein
MMSSNLAASNAHKLRITKDGQRFSGSSNQ